MVIKTLPELNGKRFYHKDYGDVPYYQIIDHIEFNMSFDSDQSSFQISHNIIDKTGQPFPLYQCWIDTGDDFSDLYSKAVLRQNKSI